MLNDINMLFKLLNDNGLSKTSVNIQSCLDLLAEELGTVKNAVDKKITEKIKENDYESVRTLLEIPSLALSIQEQIKDVNYRRQFTPISKISEIKQGVAIEHKVLGLGFINEIKEKDGKTYLVVDFDGKEAKEFLCDNTLLNFFVFEKKMQKEEDIKIEKLLNFNPTYTSPCRIKIGNDIIDLNKNQWTCLFETVVKYLTSYDKNKMLAFIEKSSSDKRYYCQFHDKDPHSKYSTIELFEVKKFMTYRGDANALCAKMLELLEFFELKDKVFIYYTVKTKKKNVGG